MDQKMREVKSIPLLTAYKPDNHRIFSIQLHIFRIFIVESFLNTCRMKNILLILSILFVEVSVFSQQINTRTDSTIAYEFTSPTDSIQDRITITKYDSNGNQTYWVSYNWDLNLNDWVGSQKRECTFDSYGNQTLNAIYEWDSNSNKWIGERRYEYAYDSNGNQTLYALYYGWDSNLNDWVGNYKEEGSYDSNGNKTLYVFYVWDSNLVDWVENSKIESTYDSNDNEILEESYNWDSSIIDWVAIGKLNPPMIPMIMKS